MPRPLPLGVVAALAIAAMLSSPLRADLATGIRPRAEAPQSVVVPAGYRYVRGDEFDGPAGSAPDPAKRGYEYGFIRNQEPQFYTKDRRENARVEKGLPVITGLPENWSEGGKTAKYTAASVISQGEFAFKYGRVEIRAKLPEGVGKKSSNTRKAAPTRRNSNGSSTNPTPCR